MYSIEKTDYGLKITFEGEMSLADLVEIKKSSKSLPLSSQKDFGVIFDLRNIKPMKIKCLREFVSVNILYKRSGLTRAAIILSNQFSTRQAKRLAKESDVYKFERFIDSSSMSNWEKTAIDWIKYGADPDVKISAYKKHLPNKAI